MNDATRKYLFWATLLAVIAVPAFMVGQKEKTLEDGQFVLLRLQQYDPRSLMQGDFMRLGYDVPEEIRSNEDHPRTGKVVLKLDENQVGIIDRIYASGEDLNAGEQLLVYRKRRRGLFLGPDAFFFQEGHADAYVGAMYGGLRVDEAGNSVLVGLYDSAYVEIIPPDIP